MVRDSDPAQTVVAQRTCRSGRPLSRFLDPQRPGLATGNATGLQVLVDDKPLPALGGTVRKSSLDLDRLLAGTAQN